MVETAHTIDTAARLPPLGEKMLGAPSCWCLSSDSGKIVRLVNPLGWVLPIKARKIQVWESGLYAAMICVMTLLSRTFFGFMILVSGTIVSAAIVAGLIDLNTFCLHSSGHFGNSNGKGLQSFFHCSEFLFLRL